MHNFVKDHIVKNKNMEIISASTEETMNTGKRIAKLLYPGSIIALKGGLGSGKTYLAKGIALGLGIEQALTSPTYSIINEYQLKRFNTNRPNKGCRILYHIDAYRLKGETDFDNIGGTEILNAGGICLIEWSDRIENLLPDNTITISMEITGQTTRKIKINGIK